MFPDSEKVTQGLIDTVSGWSEKIDTGIINTIVSHVRSQYKNIMDSYCDWLDTKGISPNQVVTGRIVTGIGAGAFLASDNHGVALELAGNAVLGFSFLHDAVDGHLARKTQQTSPEGETLDALGDKEIVFSLIAILVCYLDVSPALFCGIIGVTGVALILDIKSQLLRNNNLAALKKSLQKPLTQAERMKNPNTKSPGAAVSAGKIKTALIMSGISLAYAEDIIQTHGYTGTILLSSIIASTIFAVKSLQTKGVTLQNFFRI